MRIHTNDTNNYSSGRIRIMSETKWARRETLSRSETSRLRTLRYSGAGFTLIEMIVYIALITIVITITTPFIFRVINSYARIKANQVAMSDAKLAMDYITREVQSAKEAYTSTSIFDSNPGQLSLVTRIDTPTDETETYIDFYMDAGRLYIKREGQDTFAVTSDRTTLSNLTFKHLNPSDYSGSIQVQLTVDYNAPTDKFEFQASQNLTSSVSFRGQY